ncbi:MAG: TonB-dependent receptor, partial [Proteobacteria bacterium]|nr:TonB-dependent receptor [Pseudomonadota bacterium]
LKQTRIDLHGERNMDFGPFTLARIAAGYADYEHAELEDGAVGTRFLSDGYEGRFELVQEGQSGRQGAIGVQILHRNLDAIGDEAYVPRTRVDEAGLFTLQRLDNEAWGVEGGLRVDGRRLESTVGSRSFVNVSVSGGVFARPAESWFFGLALSRTTRAPTEAELFADGAHVATRGFEIGDSGLGSEISYSADATVRYNAERRGRFSADMHLFTAIYDSFIDLRPTGAVKDGLAVFAYNQTTASFYGFEAEVGLRLWQEGAGSFTLEGVVDFVRGDTDNAVPARIPPFSVTGRAVVTGSSWLAQFEIRHVGGQHRVTAFELPTDGYTMLNGRFEFHPSSADGLTVFASVRNLGDVEAREHTSFLKDVIPFPGRSFRIGTAYRF